LSVRHVEGEGLSVLHVEGEGLSMIHHSFPSAAFTLFSSPFKPVLSSVEGGEVGRGMGLPMTPPSGEASVFGGVGA
jgi:hypothetical protein